MTTRLVRSVAAFVILTVLAVQLGRAAGRGVDVVNYLSYFTIFSNASAAVVLISLAIRPSLVDSEKFTVLRGAVTLCMCLTALFYGTIISPGFEGAARHGLGLSSCWPTGYFTLLHDKPSNRYSFGLSCQSRISHTPL
jgi:hypothetical protein